MDLLSGTHPKERRAPQRLEGAFIALLVRQNLQGASETGGRQQLEGRIGAQGESGDSTHVGYIRDKRASQSLQNASDPGVDRLAKRLEYV